MFFLGVFSADTDSRATAASYETTSLEPGAPTSPVPPGSLPPAVQQAFLRAIPNSQLPNILAHASVGGMGYYVLWDPEGRGGAFSLSACGIATRIDKGVAATLPCVYLAWNENVWRALQADFIRREIVELGGREAVQRNLDKRKSMVLGLAQSYREAGFSLPPNLLLRRGVDKASGIGTAAQSAGIHE